MAGLQNKGFWDRYLRVYDTLNDFSDYSQYLVEVAEGLGIVPGEKVLDAGCGTGNLSIRLRRRGAEVIGLDFSPVALAIHKEKDPSAILVNASLEEPLPFPEGTFDRVVCTSVLFALSEEGMKLAMSEFYRVLKPEGSVVITAMRPGGSRLEALMAHLRTRIRAQPLGAFVREAARTLMPLLQVVYYNYRMYGLRKRDGYRRLTRDDLLREVAQGNFTDATYSIAYRGRFHVVRAKKPKAAGNVEEKPHHHDWPLSAAKAHVRLQA